MSKEKKAKQYEDKTISTVLGAFKHELNNSLCAVRVQIELMSEGGSTITNENLTESRDRIISQLENILINDKVRGENFSTKQAQELINTIGQQQWTIENFEEMVEKIYSLIPDPKKNKPL